MNSRDLITVLNAIYLSGRRPNGDTLSDIHAEVFNELSGKGAFTLNLARTILDEEGVDEEVYQKWINN